MGFICLIAMGGILGWLASILARADEQRGIWLNVLVGVIAALVAGALASDESLLIGLSARALLLASAGSVLLLASFNALRASRLRKDTF